MAIGDWFLARSEAFRFLMVKFKEHKNDTIRSFSRVKSHHRRLETKIDSYEERIKELEKILASLNEPQKIVMVKKKKK